MDPITNPFAPGAGTPPPELAGRDEQRETVHIALERIRRSLPTKSVLMIGLRGVRHTNFTYRGSGRQIPSCNTSSSVTPFTFEIIKE
jgi:hypothetical protein